MMCEYCIRPRFDYVFFQFDTLGSHTVELLCFTASLMYPQQACLSFINPRFYPPLTVGVYPINALFAGEIPQ